MPIRTYQPGDEPKIQGLFTKVFGKERSLSVWEWKFLQHPNDFNPWILVFEEEEAILGHISLWIGDAWIEGKRRTVGLRIDTMVDPDARGKGIYKKLNEKLLQHANDQGIDFLYGFPAEKAKELFLRYTGAAHMTDMPRYVLMQRPVALLSSKIAPLKLLTPLDGVISKWQTRKIKPHNGTIQDVTAFDHTFDELAEATRHQAKAQLVRDADYLNWRYKKHPEKTYHTFAYYKDDTLRGYLTYSIQDQGSYKNGFIVDWLAREEQDWDVLLQEAAVRLKQVDVIQTWSLTTSPSAQTLLKHGFIHKDSPMPLVGKDIADDTAHLQQPEAWYITPGDIDSF
ncbi:MULTISPECIES: GNAT family N-acetyltransferase [Pontibacillus]|uniref:GNAT family N-acetyltransferase n=1 Tax=Pontibacillus chungwhensis TaxID=265426 RepID=A0ABY8UXV6_9BACI|nr:MULTISPECIES: GNAT family N-acetyltransferase [Pontibacillus]MCD5324101.1 GNAT family N-acetyltransferase [Pontibacillus sp. HN14]WIF97842.1 GNAT family N-acetyltransferase [Pontibacillus chungwhensis]